MLNHLIFFVGNWVPLDEFYYGKSEGDPSYTEEKSEFRFKVCSLVLRRNMLYIFWHYYQGPNYFFTCLFWPLLSIIARLYNCYNTKVPWLSIVSHTATHKYFHYFDAVMHIHYFQYFNKPHLSSLFSSAGTVIKCYTTTSRPWCSTSELWLILSVLCFPVLVL